MLSTHWIPIVCVLFPACAATPTVSLAVEAPSEGPPVGVAPAATAQEPEVDHGDPPNVAIVLFPSVELLDFAGPGEVFAATHTAKGHGFHVYTVAESRAPLKSMGFLTVTPEYTFDDCPAPDIVVVPGGHVPLDSAKLRAWVRARAQSADLMMSVCNGALVLASAGLLEGLEVTTHHSALNELALIEPNARVLTNRRFVDSGRVLTSAGISAGIDGALHVVERTLGEEIAWRTARYMEYDWRPDEIARQHAEPGKPVSAQEALQWVASIREHGADVALARYKELPDPPTEGQMNTWGYTLLGTGQADAAIALFDLVAHAFPQSSNALDSLSEACELQGERQRALTAARGALALVEKESTRDDDSRAILRNSARSRVARLTGESARLKYECAPCGRPCDRVRYLEAGKCPGCPMQLAEITPAR